jgi:hypothetical protein
MYIITHQKECRKRFILHFRFLTLLFFIFSIFFTSCKWFKSTDDEKPCDSVIVVTIPEDSSLIKKPLPFVNRQSYFYEDIVDIAGKIELLEGSFVLDSAYVLSLDKEIEVFPKKEIQDMEDPNMPQLNIRQIHLLWTDSKIDINLFADKRTVVKGTLWGRYSGSHYTPVVMDVISMRLDN